MSTLTCTCGETFFVGDVPRGAQIRCRRCGSTIDVHDALRTAKASTASWSDASTKSRRGPKANPEDLVILPERPSLLRRLLGVFGDRGGDSAARGPRSGGVRTRHLARRPMATPTGVAVGTYAAIMFGLFGYLYLQADESAVGMYLLFAPRWWCLIPWVILLPAALFTGWRTSVVGVAGAAVTLFGVAGFQLPSIDTPDTTRRAMRIVTYNAERSVAVAPLIREAIPIWNADVVLLQGCSPMLADSLDAIEGFNVDVQPDFCAVARLPLERIDVMSADGATGGPATDVIRYHVRTALGVLPVYSVRLEAPGATIFSDRPLTLGPLAQSVARRKASSRAAALWISHVDTAFVVAGDFNLPYGSGILRSDWGDLTNAFSEVGMGFGHTLRIGRFAERSDHVLLPPTLVPVAVRRIAGFPTAHQPVMADLDWRQ